MFTHLDGETGLNEEESIELINKTIQRNTYSWKTGKMWTRCIEVNVVQLYTLLACPFNRNITIHSLVFLWLFLCVESSGSPTSTISVRIMDCKFLTTSWLWGRLFSRSQPVTTSTQDDLRFWPAVNIWQPTKYLFGGLRPSLPMWTYLSPADIWKAFPCHLSSVTTGKERKDNQEVCRAV